MSEVPNDLLAKVESALHAGDQRRAGILLHKILLQDFTNRRAWLLLQQLRGDRQPLEDFQPAFARRYYPNLAHLLDQMPEPEPTPQQAEIRSEPAPTAVPANRLFCPFCGAAILPKAIFCSFCGRPLSQDREQAQTVATPVSLPGERKQAPPNAEQLPAASTSMEPGSPTNESAWQPIEFETLGAESEALSEVEKKMITSELQELESLINKPEPQPAQVKPLTGELDRVLKRSTSPPRGTGSLDPSRLPPRRRPYCPTCRKLFEPDDLFCDICWSPLFQMVDKIPEEPAVKPQSAEDTGLHFISPPISEPEIPTPPRPEPEPEVPAIAPLEPEYDPIEDIRAALMPESAAPSSSESSPRTQKSSAHRSTPRLFQFIRNQSPFVKGMLLGLALILAGICLGVIGYVGYQIWLG